MGLSWPHVRRLRKPTLTEHVWRSVLVFVIVYNVGSLQTVSPSHISRELRRVSCDRLHVNDPLHNKLCLATREGD